MAGPGTGDERVIGRLLREVDRRAPYAVLDVLRAEMARTLPAASVDILVADYSGTSFERMAGSDLGHMSEVVPIDGTPPGNAYASQDVVTVEDGPTLIVYQPLAAQGERLGVLEVRLPGPPVAGVLGYLEEVAIAVAYAAAVAEDHTDLYARLRRRRKLELAAEMQRQLLPALTQESERFSLAGWLEPAYEVAGDNF